MTKVGARFLLCACLVTSLFAGCERRSNTEGSKGLEQVRATSPNGQLDAVLIRESRGGAWTGWDWYVYIVAKGSTVHLDYSHSIFYASTLTGEKLVWSQEHLLEIHYDIAEIERFRNLWGSNEIPNVGSAGEQYFVEIQLKPASPGFSLLSPDGRFRREQ